jgi:hypothetical protein
MDWAAHGCFELHWEDDCLSLSLTGEWNEVTAERMATRVRQLVSERGGRPWAPLSDARDWEGATPDDAPRPGDVLTLAQSEHAGRHQGAAARLQADVTH